MARQITPRFSSSQICDTCCSTLFDVGCVDVVTAVVAAVVIAVAVVGVVVVVFIVVEVVVDSTRARGGWSA
eukprot:6210814-Pleurochrysis_carterae.AAC.2